MYLFQRPSNTMPAVDHQSATEGRPSRNLQAATSRPGHGPSSSPSSEPGANLNHHPPSRTTRERSSNFDFREVVGLYTFKKAKSTAANPADQHNHNTSPDADPILNFQHYPLTSTSSLRSQPVRAPTAVSASSTSTAGPSAQAKRSPTSTSKPPAIPILVDHDPFYSADQQDWSAHFTSSYHCPSYFPTSRCTANTPNPTSHTEYGPNLPTASPPRPPTTPISPRWDSLAYSPTTIYSHARSPHDERLSASAKALATCPTEPQTPTKPHCQITVGSLASELRDEFQALTPVASPVRRLNMISSESRSVVGDHTLVSNFSRPRRPSVQNASPDALRERTGNSPQLRSESAHTDTIGAPNQYLLARDRGLSISSNKSTSTFASLPVRPSPDLHYRDSIRGRSRQAHPPLTRQPLSYSRAESTGHSLTREILPRMASMPSEELRSSFRSQLSASTTPGTVQTERSSVLTKSSSVASIYVPVDDGFSVDDIMGIYEKGFRDDSPARTDYQEDDSRPPTARSERSRRKTALLEAFSDSLPMQATTTVAETDKNERADTGSSKELEASATWSDETTIVRDSAAIFGSDSMAPVGLVEDVIGQGPLLGSEDLVDDGPEDEPCFPEISAQEVPIQSSLLERTSIENTDVTRDRYGFRKENQYVTQVQYDNWNGEYSDYLERRRRKWQGYLKESGLMTDDPIRFPPRSAKTKRYIRKGIPPEWRGAAWFYYAGGPAILSKHGGLYGRLLAQQAKDIDQEAIERDLHRTFPDNVRFRAANSSSAPNTEHQESRSSQSTVLQMNGNAARPNETDMISSLRRVLHAFSIYNPRIGYCQSLNFLAGLLLLFSETEEQAFWLLNIITRVYLPGTHETSLEGANVDLGVLMTSVQETMPAIWSKIGGELDGTDAVKPKSRRHRKGAIPIRLPPVTLCMTAWFMSCFIGTLPIETTLRVWDIFFYEGSKTLFRIALTIFKLGENEIKSVGDPMEIFQVVQTIPRRLLDANAMMEACFKRRNGFGHISQETIEERRMERRKNVKLDRERMATGLADDPADLKRKNMLFGRKKRPTDIV